MSQYTSYLVEESFWMCMHAIVKKGITLEIQGGGKVHVLPTHKKKNIMHLTRKMHLIEACT